MVEQSVRCIHFEAVCIHGCIHGVTLCRVYAVGGLCILCMVRLCVSDVCMVRLPFVCMHCQAVLGVFIVTLCVGIIQREAVNPTHSETVCRVYA